MAGTRPPVSPGSGTEDAAKAAAHPDLMGDAEKQRIKQENAKKEEQQKRDDATKNQLDAGAHYNRTHGFIVWEPVDITLPEYEEFTKKQAGQASSRVFAYYLPDGLYKKIAKDSDPEKPVMIRFSKGHAALVPEVDWYNASTEQRLTAIKQEFEFLKGQGCPTIYFTFGRSDRATDWHAEPRARFVSATILVEKILTAFETKTVFNLKDPNTVSLIDTLTKKDLDGLLSSMGPLSKEHRTMLNAYMQHTGKTDLKEFIYFMEKQSQAFKTRQDVTEKVSKNVAFDQFKKEMNSAKSAELLPASKVDEITKDAEKAVIPAGKTKEDVINDEKQKWLASDDGKAWLESDKGLEAVEKRVESIASQIEVLEAAHKEVTGSLEGVEEFLKDPAAQLGASKEQLDPVEVKDLIESFEKGEMSRNDVLNVIEKKKAALFSELDECRPVLDKHAKKLADAHDDAEQQQASPADSKAVQELAKSANDAAGKVAKVDGLKNRLDDVEKAVTEIKTKKLDDVTGKVAKEKDKVEQQIRLRH